MESRVDNVTPKPKWEFDGDVAKCFANMLERSIPDYKSMRSMVYELGEKFVKPGTWITDIGCSTGLAIEPFYNTHKDECGYFMVDNSEAMIQECECKFAVGIEQGNVKLVNGNFWEAEMPEAQSLVTVYAYCIQTADTQSDTRSVAARRGFHTRRKGYCG